MKIKDSFLVCPECLCFDDDFGKGFVEKSPCPYCLNLDTKEGPLLVTMNRREFHTALALKIINEVLK